MTDVVKHKYRSQQAAPGAKGQMTFNWQTTDTSLADAVTLIMPPGQTLPIVFVPGIMGSNLITDRGQVAWLLNSIRGQPVGLAWKWASNGAGPRQRILHPARTQVFSGGNVPKEKVGTCNGQQEFLARGWGEVGETSYHAFLLWLEQKFNGEGSNPAQWEDFFYSSTSAAADTGRTGPEPKLSPGMAMQMKGMPAIAEDRHMTEPITSDELLKRARFRFPVYACGYNWLASNSDAANRLKARIDTIIAANNRGAFKCEQVILVTHSMGGLVARACAQLPGMEEKIAGIVHGVMPAIGAAVAYRRCKVGMQDEDFVAGLVIGSDGREVTAVFAQAPGALQLLPTQEYRSKWLRIKDPTGNDLQLLPVSDPYAEIYLRKDRWWGLVREEWLKPEGGIPIEWSEFVYNIGLAKDFHRKLAGKYHPNTFVFYGAGDGKQASFEAVRWNMKRGLDPGKGIRPTTAQTVDLTHQQVREDGANAIYVGGESKLESAGSRDPFGGPTVRRVETSFWEISCGRQDGRGDGTVPASSGMAPRASGGKNIRQQFRLEGFSHEPAFGNPTAQRVTHYAITKIVVKARIS
jgi:pimeloyl-ACP methyl ester carboxylesterase